MNIQYIPVADIVPYENNPRINNKTAELLQDSIRKFGFTNPLLLDSQNVIVSGHARFKAALALGLDLVPCVYITDLTEAQLREFRIMVNKSGEYSEWDFRKLDTELQDIAELDSKESSDLEKYFGLSIGDALNKDELTKPKPPKEPEPEDDNIVTCPFCGHSFDPDNPDAEEEPEEPQDQPVA